MMGEYVKRSDALQAVGDIHPLDYNGQGIVERIKAIPAADVVEARHGWWIIEDKYTDYRTERCSACGFVANRSYAQDVWFYCPRCGAKMGGGQDDV